MDSNATPFTVRVVEAGSSVLVDHSCGACPSCRTGAPVVCSAPDAGGRIMTAPVATDAAGLLLTALVCAAALVEAPAVSTVVVAASASTPLSVLARAATGATVLAAQDFRDPDLRAELERREPSGRAPVVVAGADVRAAVRAVRRGGHVCVGAPATDLPSVTELVQREITLVGPRDVGGFLRRLPEDIWSAAVSAAA